MLPETKKFLSSSFDMKDLNEASFLLGIEIHRDRRKEVLGAYVEKVVKMYSMQVTYASSHSQG